MINNEDAVVISDNAKYLFHNDQAIILNRTNRQRTYKYTSQL